MSQKQTEPKCPHCGAKHPMSYKFRVAFPIVEREDDTLPADHVALLGATPVFCRACNRMWFKDHQIKTLPKSEVWDA